MQCELHQDVLLQLMVGEICVEQKEVGWPYLQNLRKCVAFKAYGYSFYDQTFVENI